MKQFLFTLLIYLAILPAFGQTPETDSLLRFVNDLQHQRLKSIFTEDRDSVFQLFDSAVVKLFNQNDFCDLTPDTSYHSFLSNLSLENKPPHYLPYALMNNIVICGSEDKKIRTFSWDDLGGGSSHSYTNFIQYTIANGDCRIIAFDTAEFSLDVGYYDIKTLKQNGRSFYFLFGYGTYGSGLHHQNLRIFEIENDRLTECFECYPEHKAIELFSNRSQDIKLKLNTKSKELSFKKYMYDEDLGFYQKEFENVKLIFKGAEFTLNK